MIKKSIKIATFYLNKNGLKFDSSSRDSIRLKQNRIDSNYGYSTQLNQIKNLFEAKIYLSQKISIKIFN